MKHLFIAALAACGLITGHAQKQKVTSVLEVMDIATGQRTVVKEFPFLIEAPNWTPDGNWLVYNSGGKLYKLSPDSPGEPQAIDTGYATRCNNDHVISADGKQVVFITYKKGDLEPGQHLANKNVELRLMPAEGGEPQTIARLFGGQGTINVNSWAPDSKRFAFVSYRLE